MASRVVDESYRRCNSRMNMNEYNDSYGNLGNRFDKNKVRLFLLSFFYVISIESITGIPIQIVIFAAMLILHNLFGRSHSGHTTDRRLRGRGR